MTMRQSLHAVRGCVAVGVTITAVAFAAYWWGNSTLYFSHGDARWYHDMLNEGCRTGLLWGELSRDFRSGLGIWLAPSVAILDLPLLVGMIPDGYTNEAVFCAIGVGLFYFAGWLLARSLFASRHQARVIGVLLAFVTFMPSPFMWSRVPLQGSVVQAITMSTVSLAALIRSSWTEGSTQRTFWRSLMLVSLVASLLSWGFWSLVIGPIWLLLAVLFASLSVSSAQTRSRIWPGLAVGFGVVMSTMYAMQRLVAGTASVSARTSVKGVVLDQEVARFWLFDDVFPILIPGTTVNLYGFLITGAIVVSSAVLVWSEGGLVKRSVGIVSAIATSTWLTYGLVHYFATRNALELGPSPGYFAVALFPIWLVCMVFAAGVVFPKKLIARCLNSLRFTDRSSFLGSLRGRSSSAPVLMLGLILWLVVWGVDNRQLREQQVWYPVKASAVVAEVSNRLGTSEAPVFQGRAFLLQEPMAQKSQLMNKIIYPTVDTKLLREQLLSARIPTLNVYSHLMSPEYAISVNRWFTSGRPFVRLWSSFERFDTKLAEMLGIRFLLAEPKAVIAEADRRKIAPLGEFGGTKLFELSRPNLGDFSPVNPVQIEGLANPLEYMASTRFDPRVDVLVEESIEQLVPAVSSSMTAERGRVTVDVETSGRSLLVLPIEYSTCMKLVASPVSAKVMRVNYLLTGLLVEGSGRFEIDVKMNPYFQRTSCF